MPGTVESSWAGTASQATYAVADIRRGKVSPLPANLKRRFYPPIMLLETLNSPGMLKRRNHEGAPRGDEYDPQEIFHNFVNRLALICHVEPNGDAVSSCVVTEEPDKVVYVIASNHRSEKQLAFVAEALRAILGMASPLHESPDADDSETRGKMLRAALDLCWVRVRSYLKGLAKELDGCTTSCELSGNERDIKLGVVLGQVAASVAVAVETAETAKHSDRESFTLATEAAIEELEELHKTSYLFSLIRRRVAREHQHGNGGCWSDMCHTSDRLKAYKSAIDAIFIARDNWPKLFEDFEVRFVPSPDRIPNPLQAVPRTSAQIIAVSTSHKTLLPRLQEDIIEMQQKHDIDSIIAMEWKKGIKPTVHAEVQIHSWLESSGDTRSGRFFGGYKFIGSSKPTCKLCSYYFDECGTDIKVRHSHRNLYTHWRVPDLYHGESEGRRMLLHDKIKARIVADIERTISEKRADHQNNDSTDRRGRDMESLLSASLADTMSSAMDNLSIIGEADDDSGSVETITFQGRRAGPESRRRNEGGGRDWP